MVGGWGTGLKGRCLIVGLHLLGWASTFRPNTLAIFPSVCVRVQEAISWFSFQLSFLSDMSPE